MKNKLLIVTHMFRSFYHKLSLYTEKMSVLISFINNRKKDEDGFRDLNRQSVKISRFCVLKTSEHLKSNIKFVIVYNIQFLPKQVFVVFFPSYVHLKMGLFDKIIKTNREFVHFSSQNKSQCPPKLLSQSIYLTQHLHTML